MTARELRRGRIGLGDGALALRRAYQLRGFGRGGIGVGRDGSGLSMMGSGQPAYRFGQSTYRLGDRE